MPLYDYQCPNCGRRDLEFVWTNSSKQIMCRNCKTPMIKLFTTSNLVLLNRQKPVPFKFEPKEGNADKEIWQTVIHDAEKGKLKKGELEHWKKEVSKSNPNIIL